MNPVLDAALRSWPFDPALSAMVLATALVYVRGWWSYHRRDSQRWPIIRLLSFLSGLTALHLALASPVEPFASLFLSVHMVQHLVLMMLAPPLLWLGNPLLPLIRGLPALLRTYWVIPLFQIAWLRRWGARLTHPVSALGIFVVATWVWHMPELYNLALQSPPWHYLQHASFLGAGLLLWYPVVRPYPMQPHWPLWLLFPYLLLADLSNTLLSALLSFSDRVIYAYYAQFASIEGVSALDDQATAGAIMWVPGSLAFLLPLFALAIRFLTGELESPRTNRKTTSRPDHYSPVVAVAPRLRVALPLLTTPQTATHLDLLRVPVMGRLLRWRHSRTVFQLLLLVLAILVVTDGILGPEIAPMNMAGVLPWIHWRALLILSLLIAGNFFCYACPFMLPRNLARRWLPVGRNWPRALRGKWLAIGLVVVFFTAYEAFSLWDNPRLTALIIVGYFLAAFLIDGWFRGAAFCKYVCPIGQFNFVQSLVSPLEVAVRDPAVCATCTTKDCIRGRDRIPGCELELAQPRKQGNLDCTFCLDCAHACPHGNIGLLAGAPTRGLADDPVRSGVGRYSQRTDLAVLVLVLVCAAFTNAAGMIGPVMQWEQELQAQAPLLPRVLLIGVLNVFALLVFPLVGVGIVAAISKHWGRLRERTLAVANRFVYALIPLGFAMWLAHYGYHLATSYGTAWSVTQRFATDLGWSTLGEPIWRCGCCEPVGTWLVKTELLILDVGLLLSLYTAWRIARRTTAGSRAVLAWLPWAIILTGLFALGVWILLQPMQMRGTMSMM